MSVVSDSKIVYDLLPVLARTDHTTGNQVLQYNKRCKGIRLTINITAFTGTSITFTLVGIDPTAGTTSGTLLASAAKSATGIFTMTVYPGITVAANVSAADLLPEQWKLVPSGTITTVTYGVRAELIP